MAKFFIDRPIFAMVIAIVITLIGAVAIPSLPIATYPEVVPPVVQITAIYRWRKFAGSRKDGCPAPGTTAGGPGRDALLFLPQLQ